MFIFITKEKIDGANQGGSGEIRIVPPEKIGVVVIAIQNYKNKSWSLNGPLYDANNFISMLVHAYSFPEQNILRIFDSKGTKPYIINTIREIRKSFEYLVFYYSGHGTQAFSIDEPDYKDEILVTYDMDWKNEETILTDNEIRQAIIDFKHVWFFADCCHAEGLSKDPQAVVRSVTPQKIKLTMKPTIELDNTTDFYACLSSQSAMERPHNGKWQGDFTRELCQILREHNNISYSQLQYELKNRITSQTPTIQFHSDTSLFALN